MSRSLLIVAHAPSENTKALRDAALDGAREAGGSAVTVRCLTPFEADADAVRTCGAILLGTTENLGYMSGALKDFFDRIYYPCLEETQGLPYALFVRAGHDGTGTCRAVASITTGLRWRAVQEPLVCRGAYDPNFVDQCRELGAGIAAGLEAGIF
ncbi:MAG: flavodoxin family protein [Nisaea sp.]|uniref:flavodoxin family protein n=1 Tax=Nisaea sp. TaxID=2024842 RepID=UPI001B09C534|nr:flavodoxin family protein [Nisaea sp.]MBO6559857.1 flavodoxin family protein [Nisaea sp.]